MASRKALDDNTSSARPMTNNLTTTSHGRSYIPRINSHVHVPSVTKCTSQPLSNMYVLEHLRDVYMPQILDIAIIIMKWHDT